MVKKTTDNVKLIILAYIFVITAITTYYGKIFIVNGISDWYHFVYQPMITPPESLYPILWMIYNILLGASFVIIVLSVDSLEFPKFNYPYVTNLVLEFVWCYAVFWCRQVGWGLVLIIPYVILSFKTILIFKDGSPTAAKINYYNFAFILYMAFVNMALVSEHGLKVEVYF